MSCFMITWNIFPGNFLINKAHWKIGKWSAQNVISAIKISGEKYDGFPPMENIIIVFLIARSMDIWSQRYGYGNRKTILFMWWKHLNLFRRMTVRRSSKKGKWQRSITRLKKSGAGIKGHSPENGRMGNEVRPSVFFSVSICGQRFCFQWYYSCG